MVVLLISLGFLLLRSLALRLFVQLRPNQPFETFD